MHAHILTTFLHIRKHAHTFSLSLSSAYCPSFPSPPSPPPSYFFFPPLGTQEYDELALIFLERYAERYARDIHELAQLAQERYARDMHELAQLAQEKIGRAHV